MLVGSNATGTDKTPLLIIGKSAKPRCFGKKTVLPLQYKSSVNAWMTTTIFNDYVVKFDRRMTAAQRKVALILDNCSSHKLVGVKLESTEVFYLPPRCTSCLQPMDNGVIRSLKSRYAKMLVRNRLACYDADAAFKINILECMIMLKAVFESIEPSLLKNCFSGVGFALGMTDSEHQVSEDFTGEEEWRL